MNEREVLRAQSVNLLQRLRNEPVPQVLFELLEVMVARLDRLELGGFSSPDEVPTEPGKNLKTTSTTGLPATGTSAGKGVGERVKKIFEDIKDEDKQKP
jgi:hypothetical protein